MKKIKLTKWIGFLYMMNFLTVLKKLKYDNDNKLLCETKGYLHKTIKYKIWTLKVIKNFVIKNKPTHWKEIEQIMEIHYSTYEKDDGWIPLTKEYPIPDTKVRICNIHLIDWNLEQMEWETTGWVKPE